MSNFGGNTNSQSTPTLGAFMTNTRSSSVSGEDEEKGFYGQILETASKWPFSEAALTELIVLRQEQERTKQEQVKLQNLDRSLQLLKSSIDANIPSHLIPNLFLSSNSIKHPGLSVNNTSYVGDQLTIRPFFSDENRPAVAAANAVVSSTAFNSPNTSHNFSTDISYSANPPAPVGTMASPSQMTAPKTHQRSSTIASTKELYSNRNMEAIRAPQDLYDSISNQYITHSSPFKFPTKLHSTIPETHTISFNKELPMSPRHAKPAPKSPTKMTSTTIAGATVRSPNNAKPSIPTNEKNEPVGISSFQHVIQFHHWQLEDPAAMIRKEQLKGKDSSDSSHRRRKSNPEFLMSRSKSIDKSLSKVTKPSQAPVTHPATSINNKNLDTSKSTTSTAKGFASMAKRKMFSHARTRSEIVQSKSVHDFAKFQVGKGNNILNKEDHGNFAQHDQNKNNNDNQQLTPFNPLNSLASAALMKDQQQKKESQYNQ